MRQLPLMLAVLLVAWASAAAAAPPRPRPTCPAHDEAGWIATITTAGNVGQPADPYLVRRNQKFLDLAEGDHLCVGDVVYNPAASGLRLTLRVNGGEIEPLEPGQRYTVERVRWYQNWMRRLKALDQMMKPGGRASRATATTGVRGGPCLYQPARRVAPTARAVAAWGPLYITWPCLPDETGPWTATVRNGTGAQRLDLDANLLQLDLARSCPEGCSVAVADAAGRVVLALRIDTVSPERVPGPPWLFDGATDAVGQGLRGAWLLQPGADPAWRLQGSSLLWQVGCRVPAAGRRAEIEYGLQNPEELCRQAP